MAMQRTLKTAGRARILRVKARDFKQIREVEIDLDGNLHAIKGDTDQGKTSVLQAIRAAIQGADKGMVRHGAGAAELELELDSALIQRIISANPETKDVLFGKTADGRAIEKVQDFLNTLCGPSAFNPVRWVQLGAEGGKGHKERLRQQRDALLEAIHMSLTSDDVVEAVEALGEDYADALGAVNMDGVDFEQHPFTVCTKLQKVCMEFFSLQNSRAKDAENVLATTPAPEIAAPREALDVIEQRAKEATSAFYGARATQQGQANLAQRHAVLKAKVGAEAKELPDRAKLEKTAAEYIGQEETLTEEIKKLEVQLAQMRGALSEVQEKVKRCEDLYQRIEDQDARVADLAALEQELAGAGTPVDVDSLERAMEKAKALVDAKRARERHDAAASAAAEARGRAQVVYRLVELFRDELPKQLLGAAELPVEGLAFDEDMILIDDIPMHQLGTSKQYRIGILIAAALNPNSAFVLVDQAESMGRRDLAEVAEVARERGLQIVATFVAPDAVPGEGVTVMEGGLAKTA